MKRRRRNPAPKMVKITHPVKGEILATYLGDSKSGGSIHVMIDGLHRYYQKDQITFELI